MNETPTPNPQEVEQVMMPLSALSNLHIDGYLQGWNDAVTTLSQIQLNAVGRREILKAEFTARFMEAQNNARKQMDEAALKELEVAAGKEEAAVNQAAADSARMYDIPAKIVKE